MFSFILVFAIVVFSFFRRSMLFFSCIVLSFSRLGVLTCSFSALPTSFSGLGGGNCSWCVGVGFLVGCVLVFNVIISVYKGLAASDFQIM